MDNTQKNQARDSRSTNIKQNQTEQKTVIKYDMKIDDTIRATARRGHDIAKTFKSIGIKFKRIIPASTDISVRKQFKLSPDSNLVCIELNYNNDKSDTDKLLLVNDVKEQLLNLNSYSIIDEGVYKYDSSTQVYRLLLKISSGSPK